MQAEHRPATNTAKLEPEPQLTQRSNPRCLLDLDHTRNFVADVLGPSIHAARVGSLANGVAGVLNASTVSIHAIGQAYSALAKITPKSAVKQVDRLLGNTKICLDELLPLWVTHVIGDVKSVVLAIDWTDFDDDDHTTLCVYLVTSHARAQPLYWKTTTKSDLKDRRTGLETSMISRIAKEVPPDVKVTLVGDRAFGYVEFYELLKRLGWDYVLRFRGNITVTHEDGTRKPAEKWVFSNGRTNRLLNAKVTAKRVSVPALVMVKAKGMKEPWCLATSFTQGNATEVVKLYGRRFSIEETFRDTKDIHFGMGLSATHIRDCDRRDRLLFLVAVAHSLLTLLGAASEDSGLDRYLKVNTSKKRTHSLYRQGLYWYHALATMREDWLVRLITSFDRIVRENRFFAAIFGLK